MGEPDWQTTKPPNEELVEVEHEGEIIQVMAYWGRDGTLPHWKTEDGGTCWDVSTFTRWRKIKEN